MSFDADTALAATGERRWHAQAHERWGLFGGTFGGFVTALLVRALGEVTARPPRALTVHFLDAPRPGALEITAVIEREGRSSDAVSLRMTQDGRPVAAALATAGRWRDDEPVWLDVTMPDVPPPDACRRVEAVEGMPEFLARFDVRWVHADAGPDAASNTAWLRTDPPAALSWPLLGAMADVWMPPAFTKLGRPAIVPTLDLTVHFRVPEPPAAAWVLAGHRSDHAAGGTWTCDGRLWAPDGTLLVQSRQLALLRA